LGIPLGNLGKAGELMDGGEEVDQFAAALRKEVHLPKDDCFVHLKVPHSGGSLGCSSSQAPE